MLQLTVRYTEMTNFIKHANTILSYDDNKQLTMDGKEPYSLIE